MMIGLRVALLVVAVLSVGCGDDRSDVAEGAPGRPARLEAAADAAGELFGALAERDYARAYEDASAAFKATNSRDDFVQKMRELEVFGTLVETRLTGGPEAKDEDGRQLVDMTYEAAYALGDGPFEVTLAADQSGRWRLDHYKYDISTKTSDPPYPTSESGAERLAQRFMFLWQTRRYKELADTMGLEENEENLTSFFEDLESAGRLLSMDRKGYVAAPSAGAGAVKLDYDLEFENGRGFITFLLEPKDDAWRVSDEKGAVKYDVEYFTDGGTRPRR